MGVKIRRRITHSKSAPQTASITASDGVKTARCTQKQFLGDSAGARRQRLAVLAIPLWGRHPSGRLTPQSRRDWRPLTCFCALMAISPSEPHIGCALEEDACAFQSFFAIRARRAPIRTSLRGDVNIQRVAHCLGAFSSLAFSGWNNSLDGIF